MKPGAHVQAAIELLEQIHHIHRPADQIVQHYFKQHRYIGSHDRRMIANLVFDNIRHRLVCLDALKQTGIDQTSLNHVRERLLMIAYLVSRPLTYVIDDIFGVHPYGPSELSPDEHQLIDQLKTLSPKNNTFFLPECLQFLETIYSPEFLMAFHEQASLDLRVNTLKVSRPYILDHFNEQGIAAEPTPYSPCGIRLFKRWPIQTMTIFRQGFVEIQDEGSQLVSMLCPIKKGDDVLDLCAGAGGKTLHLAAMMQNSGKIDATDIAPGRLNQCKSRLSRAGVTSVEFLPIDQAYQQQYDCVLIDAPCSGSGTWRRHPDLKNKMMQENLVQLYQVQSSILDQACQSVKPGGFMVYITCSILPTENEKQIDIFLKNHCNFKLVFPDAWPTNLLRPFAQNGFLYLSPLHNKTDGFFAALMQRIK